MRQLLFLTLLCCSFSLVAQKPRLGLPQGHTSLITGLDFTPDGTRLLSASMDGTLKLWDVASGKLLVGSGSTGSFISPPGAKISDGARYAFFYWGQEGTPCQWDIQKNSISFLDSPESFSEDEGETTSTPSPSFSFDGTTLDGNRYYKISENSLQFWDVKTQQTLQTISIPGLPENAILTANDQILQSADPDEWSRDTVQFWLVENGELLGTFVEPEDYNLVYITPDGQYLLLQELEQTGLLKLITLKDQKTVVRYNYPDGSDPNHQSDITAAPAISPDGTILARGRGDGTIYLQDLLTGRLLKTLESRIFPAEKILFRSDNHSFFSAAKDNILRLWNLKEGRITHQIGEKYFTDDLMQESHSVFHPINDSEVLHFDNNFDMYHYEIAGSKTVKKQIFSNNNPKATTFDYIGYSRQLKSALLLKDYGDFDIPETISQIPLTSENSSELTLYPPSPILGISPTSGHYVSFSYSGERRAFTPMILSFDGFTSIKNLAPGQVYNDGIDKAVYSTDGTHMLFLEHFELKHETTTQVWNLESGSIIDTLTFDDYDYATSGAFSPDNAHVALGTWNGGIGIFKLQSDAYISLQGHRGQVNDLSFSPDGKKLLSASNDGTLKLWDLGSKKEIATIINIGNSDWAVITPDGLFDASQNAMKVMYFVVSHEGKQEVIELEQLMFKYHFPGLLQTLLGYSNETLPSREGLENIALYPSMKAEIKGHKLNVKLTPRNGGMGKVSLFINGKELVEDINPDRLKEFSHELTQYKNYYYRHPDSLNIVRVTAFNQEDWFKGPNIDIPFKTPAQAKGQNSNDDTNWVGKLDPKMYVLTIGTGNYSGKELDLAYADGDAISMAIALQTSGSNLYKDSLETYCLTSNTKVPAELAKAQISWSFANKENIKSILDDIKARAKAEDVLLVYLSGHGLTRKVDDQNQFYYLTQGFSNEKMINAKETRDKYAVSSEELTRWVKDVPALKQVLIIDACNSGNLVDALTRNLNGSQILAFQRMKYRTGMFVIAGSAANKVSYEANEYGQGLLTYALLKGMMGPGHRNTSQGTLIDVMKLFQHARDEVPKLAEAINGIQQPRLGFPSNGSSIDIGLFGPNVIIPVADPKPVINKINFLNAATTLDELNLVDSLEISFLEETERGGKADFIFTSTKNYPNAYSVTGLYTISEGKILVQAANLVQHGKVVKTLSLPAEMTSITKLVKLIKLEVKDAF